MRSWFPAALLAGAVGCQLSSGFVCDEVDHFDGAFAAPEGAPNPPNGSGSNDAGVRDISDLRATCDEDALQSSEAALELSASAGGIAVTHRAVDTWCDTAWSVTWWAVDSDIYVVYNGNVAEPDLTCACAWTLEYTLSGLMAGEYTVHTARGSGTVTLP